MGVAINGEICRQPFYNAHAFVYFMFLFLFVYVSQNNYTYSIHITIMKVSDILDFHKKHSSLLTPVIYILVIVFLNYVIPKLMNVFSVEQSSYINYIMFADAMILFYIILPKKGFMF